jgi:cephalosporin hydroxylase
MRLVPLGSFRFRLFKGDRLSALTERSVKYYKAKRVAPTWRGRPCFQFRDDLWRYAEICYALHPAFVIEIGTAQGATAMFFADVMARFGAGRVITIDPIRPKPELPILPNLTYVQGSSTDPEVIQQVEKLTAGQRGLVTLDGDHSSYQVRAELALYADLADYLIVQDTIMHWLDMSDNPFDALQWWYPQHADEFLIEDDSLMDETQHPGGWLQRRKVEF